ncbi:uncharacterized protein LOC128237307 isoform X2 [Mya arenaria]|nr:uncharacterized protein LOC128237307 isoform X2 [Mya arenaria]XP_052808661.1 uncharacterized protein LOC128237307 isoform X2 [Mya arenaria]XP_052808662.1 uncharacterized protein LOC128237307 isoform X2 [Mya arenaria]XP_052808663.1 uncharacterized protein LOC128237307 isoform X2 [Mya arenaria]XP_052808664.1 uncharacterized protein LOC128237307 isoform X2 [Mya arenaria]XP_052808665.1 uncharacterized protein LOC128237307 isoform X2 [Mya arenaria]
MNGIRMLALPFIIILLVIPIIANNSTHGTFAYARTNCSQQGGLAYDNIVTTSLLTDYKENNCSLASSLGLNDGEAFWIKLQAELGAYITELGCATVLPKDFTLNLTEKPSLFQCTKECLARGSMNYISFHNAQCYCMADDYSNFECSDSSHAAIYRRFQIDEEEGKHRCIVAKLNNSKFGYTSAKCSDKHLGVCVDRSTQSKLQSNCTTFYPTFSEIGRDICIPPGIYIKDEMKGKCSEYNGKLTPYLYQDISHYLLDGLYFQDSFLTFDPQTDEEYSGSEDFLACLSITKQGCMLILETDKCDNVNRYLCGEDIHFEKQTGASTRMDSDCIVLSMCLFLKIITY